MTGRRVEPVEKWMILKLMNRSLKRMLFSKRLSALMKLKNYSRAFELLREEAVR